jgi:putative hemolysin
MCELAIVSSRRSHLERLAGAGYAGARAALILANDPARFLAVLQIGITTVAVLTGTFSGATLAHRLDGWLDLFPAVAPIQQAGCVRPHCGVCHISITSVRGACAETDRF